MNDALALGTLLALATACAAVVTFTQPGQAPALAVRAAAWLGRRHRANAYHRARYDRERCHAKPTVGHRAVTAVRCARSLRLTAPAEAPAIPMSAVVTIPDGGPFAARTTF